MAEVTRLLDAAAAGDPRAAADLLPLVYEELRKLAAVRLAEEKPGQTLQATALVHEAYLRLVGPGHPNPQNRAHLFALAARLMRQILVDHARKKQAQKRGGPAAVVTLHESVPGPDSPMVDILALDEALNELAAFEQRLCQVVEMRFFAGLTIDETAEALKVSTATVERDWTVAKAWLHQRLGR
jgi:RNA polymerase sigma factor (TIGR02999 family)